MDNVQELIKQISGVDIFQETRKQEVVEYRAVANLFLNKILGYSLMNIVRWYQSNGKNSHHATIIFSINNYDIYKKYNKDLEKMFNTLLSSTTSTTSILDIIREIKDFDQNQLSGVMRYVYKRKQKMTRQELALMF
jgi:hypothetical protein